MLRKLYFWLAIISTLILVAFVWERLAIAQMFGPTSIVAAACIAALSIILFLSFFLANSIHQELVTRFWLIVLSCSATYVMLDLIVGALLIQSLSPQLISDPVRHHKLVPNAYSKFEQREFSYVQRVNTIGLRGEEVPADKPRGETRILMLGDSFTMGKGVADPYTYPALVEQYLNERCAPQEFRVLNAGVDSYAPILEFLYLYTELHTLEPDVVVLNLDMSDLVQEAAYRTLAEFDAAGRILRVPGNSVNRPMTERIRTWIDQNLYLTRLVLFYANRALGYRDLSVTGVVTQANLEVAQHTLIDDPVNRTQQWKDIFNSIVQIRDLSAQIGARFYLNIYPWGHQVGPNEWQPGRKFFVPQGSRVSDSSRSTIHELATLHKIQVFDLFDLFRSASGREPLYFNYDPHMTASGYALMAQGVLTHLLEVSPHRCESPISR